MNIAQFIRSRKVVTAIAVIVTLTAGLLIGLWASPPNGLAIDGNELQPGKYFVQYPEPGSNYAPTKVATNEGPWKVLLVVHDWDVGNRLVVIDSDRVEWNYAQPNEMSSLWVSIVDGKKKFLYWLPAPKN